MPDRPAPAVSLCLVAKNEAHQIDRCLNSAKPLADELFVLDTGSTDGTPDRVRSLGARVEFFDWCDDFAAARNAALPFLTGDWVLVLDADEWLLPEAVEPLRAAIAEPDLLVVNLVRWEIGAAQSPYSLVSRLFRRHPDLRFDRPYHAIVDDSAAALMAREPRWQARSLDRPAIAHDGYRADAIAAKSKLARARRAMEAFWETHPDDPYVCSKLGALYVSVGEAERGRSLLKRGLRAAERENLTELRYELHYHLGIAWGRVQNWDLAEAHYRAAIAQPVLPRVKLGAIVNRGQVCQATGRWDEAAALYREALAIAPDLAIARYNLGAALKALGDLSGAIEQYRQAIALDPDRPEFHQNLGVALLKGGNVPASLAAFREAIARYETCDPAEAARLRSGLAEMGFRA